MNLSRRQMLARYEHVYGITPDRDEPPPERATEPDPAVQRAIERQARAERERNAR